MRIYEIPEVMNQLKKLVKCSLRLQDLQKPRRMDLSSICQVKNMELYTETLKAIVIHTLLRRAMDVFMLEGFRAVRKANLSCNYIITIDGVRKAVIAGNARIAFEEDVLTENSLICSLDDEYLLLYMAIQEMIMTKNKWLK